MEGGEATAHGRSPDQHGAQDLRLTARRVAHDVSQYLTLIQGHAQRALRSLDRAPQDPGTIREQLTRIAYATVDAAALVHKLSSLDMPASTARDESVDLGELLRQVSALTAPLWDHEARPDGRPITLRVKVDASIVVTAGSVELREAITNLVANAIDALPDGGSIELCAWAQGDRVIVEVVDTGVGMSPELQARVFEPYFSTKRDHGTGVGLTITRDIVHRLHGEIQLQSALGQGTTVRLSFPVGR
jgi:signal transduction histidine kinase